MRPISNRLFQQFRRLDGAPFLAYLTTTAQAPTKDVIPYRTLVVKSKQLVAPGSVVQAPGGRMLLLFESAGDFDWAETYRASYAPHKLSWKRRLVLTDSVSRVNKDNGLQDMGFIYTYLEKPQVVMFEKSKDTKYRILTGADVKPGDIIDGKTAKYIYDAMGIKAVEIE